MTLSAPRPATVIDDDGVRHRPLTGAQAAIWYAQQLDPADTSFVTAEYADLGADPDADSGAGTDLDPDLLARALARTVAEAPQLLATVVRGDDGEPVQRVPSEPSEPPLPVHDVADADAARAWVDADLARPTDLGAGPLLSSALLRVGGDVGGQGRWWWYLRVHHVALDGYGFTLVWRRLAEIVAALRDGADPGPSPFAGLDGVLAEDAARDTGADRDWWRERFADRPTPTVLGPQDPDGDPESNAAGTVHHSEVGLGPAVTGALDALATARGVTRAEVLVAAVGGYTHVINT